MSSYLEYLQSVVKVVPTSIKSKPFYDALMHDFNHSGYTDLLHFCYDIKNPNQNKKCLCPSCNNTRKFINFKVGYSKGCSSTCNKRISYLQNYGVDWCTKHNSVQEKIKNSFVKNHGVENISQLDTTKQKKKNTSLRKYGVDNISQSPQVKDKKIQTCVENYGVSHYFELTDKIQKHCFDHFGVGNPMQASAVKQKMIKTTIDAHGGIGFQNQHCLDRAQLAVKTLWYNRLVHKIHPFIYIDPVKLPLTKFIDHYVNNTVFNLQCNNCHSDIEYNWDEKYMLRRCEQCYPIGKMFSKFEAQLANELDDIVLVKNDRKTLNGKELDILIADKKIAIEFNGIYWYSELQGKNKNYHLDKTTQCQEKGIQLIHVFETEWLEKRNIVISVIRAKLGLFTNKVYGRLCQIRNLDKNTKKEFLEQNHLQGNANSDVNLGLYHGDELVACMTFGVSRYNKNYQWELVRFCNKLGHQVLGGASKLWKYFIKTQNPISVTTYADRRYSTGTFYAKLGFELTHVSKPNYFYFKSDKFQIKLLSRLQFQKQKLQKILPNFNAQFTEWENMQLHGYNRIWDCGNHVFVWKNHQTHSNHCG
jgi:hypothetical protein